MFGQFLTGDTNELSVVMKSRLYMRPVATNQYYKNHSQQLTQQLWFAHVDLEDQRMFFS